MASRSDASVSVLEPMARTSVNGRQLSISWWPSFRGMFFLVRHGIRPICVRNIPEYTCTCSSSSSPSASYSTLVLCVADKHISEMFLLCGNSFSSFENDFVQIAGLFWYGGCDWCIDVVWGTFLCASLRPQRSGGSWRSPLYIMLLGRIIKHCRNRSSVWTHFDRTVRFVACLGSCWWDNSRCIVGDQPATILRL